MGEMADYYYRLIDISEFEEMLRKEEMYNSCEELKRQYMIGILKWNTQHEGKVLVSKMTDSHLINAINFLKRKEENLLTNTWIEILGWELEKRK